MEVWHYDKTEKFDKDSNTDGGLFSQYVKCFMNLKLVCIVFLRYHLQLKLIFLRKQKDGHYG